MYALNAATGAPDWSCPTGSAVESSPAVANGLVHAGSDDDNVYAFGLSGGTTDGCAAPTRQPRGLTGTCGHPTADRQPPRNGNQGRIHAARGDDKIKHAQAKTQENQGKAPAASCESSRWQLPRA